MEGIVNAYVLYIQAGREGLYRISFGDTACVCTYVQFIMSLL